VRTLGYADYDPAAAERAAPVITGLAAWSPMALFERFTPKDVGVRRVVSDLAFGPHPRQSLDLYAPAESGDGPRPLLVFFYGGAWRRGAKAYYRWAGMALAAMGFVVAVPDYRLVPEVRFPDFVEDGAAAVARARQVAVAHGADPDRVVLAGHSAGAYKAVMLALDSARLRAAGVDPVVVRAAAGLAGPYDFHPFEHEAAVAAFGLAPDPLATQPVSFVRGDAPPLWLGTGDRDRLVGPYNSLSLGEKLRAVGGAAEVKLYPGLDHVDVLLALSRPFRRKAPVLTDLAGFLHANAR
jgi:acetyl esterase/lipase